MRGFASGSARSEGGARRRTSILTSHQKLRLREDGVGAGLGATAVLPSMPQEDVPDHQVHRGGLLRVGDGGRGGGG